MCSDASTITFRLNGADIGTATSSSNDCTCGPAASEYPMTVTISDSGLLNTNWNFGGNNDLEVVFASTSDPVVAGIVATVDYDTNAAPSINTVTDAPDPVTEGDGITFSVDWSDAGDQTRIHICKTDAITGQTCDGGSWCDTSSFSGASPTTCQYTSQNADIATSPNAYYAFVCDDDDACSSSSSGDFTVDAAGSPGTGSAPGFEAGVFILIITACLLALLGSHPYKRY